MFDDREPDSPVRYRRNELGRVATLPATCKVGTHTLRLGRDRIVADPNAGVVRISCTSCAEMIDVDHFWTLTTTGPEPDMVELDDAPYQALTPVMIIPMNQR